jgi:hypothetical protein
MQGFIWVHWHHNVEGREVQAGWHYVHGGEVTPLAVTQAYHTLQGWVVPVGLEEREQQHKQQLCWYLVSVQDKRCVHALSHSSCMAVCSLI